MLEEVKVKVCKSTVKASGSGYRNLESKRRWPCVSTASTASTSSIHVSISIGHPGRSR